MEYINGEIYVLPFDVHFNKRDIDAPDVMQPDLLVLCDIENNINEKDRYTGIPTLTLEILSPSTRSVDMVLKLNTFMASGVSEYWIVDPNSQRVTIYTFNEFQVDRVEHYKPGEIARSYTFEGLTIGVSAIFEL